MWKCTWPRSKYLSIQEGKDPQALNTNAAAFAFDVQEGCMLAHGQVHMQEGRMTAHGQVHMQEGRMMWHTGRFTCKRAV